MLNRLFQENADLQKVLLTVEKAIVDFRLSQLGNISTSVLYDQHECSCHKEEEKDVVQDRRNLIALLDKDIAEKRATIEQLDKEISSKLAPVVSDILAEDPNPCINEEEIGETTEEILSQFEDEEPVKEEKPKRTRKERGGTVFTDFRTLDLKQENNYEGNSVCYSSKQ